MQPKAKDQINVNSNFQQAFSRLVLLALLALTPLFSQTASSTCIDYFSTGSSKTKATTAAKANVSEQKTDETKPPGVGFETELGLEPASAASRNQLLVIEKSEPALTSDNEALLSFDSGLQVVGKLAEVIFDQGDTNRAFYVQTMGPSRILDRGQTLPGQDYKNHVEGYGTAIGEIKTIQIGEKLARLQRELNEYSPEELKQNGLSAGAEVQLVYANGIKISGTLTEIQAGKNGKTAILAFSRAEVSYGARVLFTPKFGRYDLILARDLKDIQVTDIRARLDHVFYGRKYKTDVDRIRSNAAGFFKEIQVRFAEQKLKDPSRPYGFAFPESKSALSYMFAETKNRIALYQGENGLFWRKKERFVRSIYKFFGNEPRLKAQKESLQAELDLLQLLKADIEKNETLENPAYDTILRLSYYFTKTMQMTQKRKFAPMRMYPYEWYMNSNYGLPKSELEKYRNGEMDFNGGPKFSLTQKEIFDPSKLNVIVMPVVGFLRGTDLIGTRNQSIHFATVGSQVQRADGFVLNPYTLFLHDIYFHAGMREEADAKYFAKRGFNSERQIEDFKIRQQKWFDAFFKELKAVPDQSMRFAIAQAVQTIIHDRGLPFVPSTFLDSKSKTRYAVLKGEVYVTLWQQPSKRMNPSLKERLKLLNNANKWVEQFWSKYRSEE